MRRQQEETGSPPVPETGEIPAFAVPVPCGMRSQRAEPLVLPDMPTLLPPPHRPLDDLPRSLPVVPPVHLDVGRQVLAQHVGLHEAVAARRQEADRHDQAQAAGLQLPRDAHATDDRGDERSLPCARRGKNPD